MFRALYLYCVHVLDMVLGMVYELAEFAGCSRDAHT